MKILIGCEFSGVVREAFRRCGHDAWSCDLLETEQPGQHIQDDLLHVIGMGWDAAIFHPPCTFLAVSGARWKSPERDEEQRKAVRFCLELMAAPIPKIALENPIGILPQFLGKATQIIQPWWFGHGETKATCLWLRGFVPLVATNIVDGREARVHRAAPGPDRWKDRSRTLPGVGKAMAVQWG